MKTFDTNYIDGRWVQAGGERIEVLDPWTRSPYGQVTFATESNVDVAVCSAARAFPAWAGAGPTGREPPLRRLHELIQRRKELFTEGMVQEIGAPRWFCDAIGLAMPIRNLEFAIDAARDLFVEQPMGSSYVLREPMGVAAALTPWNVPLHQMIAKVGAALVAGCTVVLKPSEVAPNSAHLFAQTMHDAGFPAGVFNMLLGGPRIGQALVVHPLVDIVSFTGSGTTGRLVAAAAGKEIKKVVLELGGKSASILLDDADLATAAPTILRQCFVNSGQACVSQSRCLVPADKLPEFERLCIKAAEGWVLGDPARADTRLGPLATEVQYERVLSFIRSGLEEGARLLVGGPDPVEELPGYFVRPTIFTDVTTEMRIAREEIFGPVLSLMPYSELDSAVEIANGLPYGLSGGVWSTNISRAYEVARRMRTGQIAINGAHQNLATPFGGFKQSGYGRENGRFGVEEFLQYKAVHGYN
jgi:acyl-CoA reductase-like NAD-dependent aldehyde dehydrogenase